MGCNFFNDAIDFVRGADTSARLGPQRLTQSGRVSPRKVMAAGVLACAVAFVAALPLLLSLRPELWIIAIASLVFAYGYTGGPFPLAYRGLGEIFVIVFFGFVAVGGTFLLYAPDWVLKWHSLISFFFETTIRDVVVASLQVGCLAAVLIAINNLRDLSTDQLAQKKTLVVIFGENFGRFQIALYSLTAQLLSVYWVSRSLYLPLVFSLLTMPIWWKVLMSVLRGPRDSTLNQSLVKSAQVHALYGLGLAVGISLWRYERQFVNWILQVLS